MGQIYVDEMTLEILCTDLRDSRPKSVVAVSKIVSSNNRPHGGGRRRVCEKSQSLTLSRWERREREQVHTFVCVCRAYVSACVCVHACVCERADLYMYLHINGCFTFSVEGHGLNQR